MGHVSIRKAERLYWLGRYTERALLTSRVITECYDLMLDHEQQDYEPILLRLGFGESSYNKEDFLKKMISSTEKQNAIFYSLEKANENSMLLRDEIGSETTAYIQMVCNLIRKLFHDRCRISDLQKVIDMLLAFWGSVDDAIHDQETRSMIKAGKFTERLAFAQRMGEDSQVIDESRKRLLLYISQIDQDHEDSQELQEMLENTENPEMEVINKKIVSLIQQ